MFVLVPAPPWSASTTMAGSEGAVEQLATGALERVGRVGIQIAQRPVRARGGQLDGTHRAGEVRMHRAAEQREVLDGPDGVDAVETLRGQFAPPEGVVFAPDGHGFIVSRRTARTTRGSGEYLIFIRLTTDISEYILDL